MTTAAAQGPRILLVDDDADLLRLLSIRLGGAGYQVTTADSAQKALGLLAAQLPQLVITDLRMAGMDGMALFEAIHRDHPLLPVIILTAHGTIPDAVAAMRRGVFGYLTKPFDARTLLDDVARALALTGAAPARETDGDAGWRAEILTRNPAMEELLRKARLAADTDASVCIYGESGTGKELLARAIHKASPRRDRPFVGVNCGAIPEQLLESELFGHVRGAFTGAARDYEGLLRSAQGGTLLLDEVGDMPAPLQVKLLRVLQEREVRPVGSTRSVPVDVRIIAATHRRLDQEVAEGRFRQDLYYRLNVVALALPALVARREDIPLLANAFVASLAAKYGRPVTGFTAEAMERLVAAPWPGNVRQLYNVVEQAVALCTTQLIPESAIAQAIVEQDEAFTSLEEARRRFERDYLTQILRITEGKVAAAARLAQRNRTEFYKLLQRHQLDPAAFKPTR